jgi:hypothetical protein
MHHFRFGTQQGVITYRQWKYALFFRPLLFLFHGNTDKPLRESSCEGRPRDNTLKLATDTSFRIHRRKPDLPTISTSVIPETDTWLSPDMPAYVHIVTCCLKAGILDLVITGVSGTTHL